MQSFIDNFKKKDVRTIQGALNRFNQFLIGEKKQGLTFGRLDELIISDFQDYIRQNSTGETVGSYFSRFKRVIKQAYRQKLIDNNPAAEVRRIQGQAKKKDTLTLEEIQTLAATPTQSDIVSRVFLYNLLDALYAGKSWDG